MLKSAIVSGAVFACLTTTHGAITVLQTEVNAANGHTYYLLSESYWTPAEAKAIELGGHLATVNDQAEHDWIWSTFSGPVDKNLWIGFTDSEAYGQSEGNWGWVSGEPAMFTNWWAGEPNGDGDFGHMWRAEIVNGLWGDRPDDGAGNPHHGLVEVVPEPSTAMPITAGVLLLALRRRMRQRT